MTIKVKIKKGDRVIVRSGKDKGKRGDVLGVLRGESANDTRVLVSGVNMIRRHTRQAPGEPGGIISKEAPIHVSKVALIDPKSDKATRVGYKFLEDGRKVRVARQSGEVLDA
ncbi:MAG: 50S ribosomal protein L24 [Alphaproteobacteria bacterium]